jgi:hypothetical protein
MSLIQDRAVYVTANSINKSLEQAIIDGDIGGGGGGGGPKKHELFNDTYGTRGGATTLTGLSIIRIPFNLHISSVRLTVFELGGVSSGSLTLDVKVNSSPDDVGMTSIFSAAPTLNFATAVAYDSNVGTLATSAFTAGQWLRVDATSVPAGWVGFFHLQAITT